MKRYPLPRLVRWFIRLVALTMVAGGLAMAVLIGYLVIAHNQPLQLPAPDGPNPVGRVEYNWTDTSRADPLADRPSTPRKLVIWVWYPAARAGAAPASYLPPAWAQVRERDQGIGVLVETSFSRIQTHSFADAPLAEAPRTYPVLLMEPGMGPITTDYTIFAENLASHGYIVVGINPTYTASWTVFLDGQSVPRSRQGAIPDSDSQDAADADGQRILAVWAQDETFVLDQLARINTDPSPFNGRLDLARVGLWGHSFGGATALAVCQQDARCQAGVDLDGTPFGEARQGTTPRPFMFISEDYQAGCDRNCMLMRQAYLNTQSGAAYLLLVAGAGHFNFSDLPYRQLPAIRPLFRLAGYEGSIRPERALQITNAYLLAFFDHHLKGAPKGLLSGPSAGYPEVTFERR